MLNTCHSNKSTNHALPRDFVPAVFCDVLILLTAVHSLPAVPLCYTWSKAGLPQRDTSAPTLLPDPSPGTQLHSQVSAHQRFSHFPTASVVTTEAMAVSVVFLLDFH